MAFLKIGSRFQRNNRRDLWTAARSSIFILLIIGGVFWNGFSAQEESGDLGSATKIHTRKLLEEVITVDQEDNA